jgi:hypothetical protein
LDAVAGVVRKALPKPVDGCQLAAVVALPVAAAGGRASYKKLDTS